MTRDAQHRATAIEYPNGETCAIQRSTNGELSEVKLHNCKWTKHADGWHFTDPSGKEKLSEIAYIKEIGDGNLKFQNYNGESSVAFSDGTSSVKHPNGARVWSDESNRPTQIDYPNGKTATIAYDREGQLTHIKSSDGLLWENGSGTWKLHDRKGNLVQEAPSVKVTQAGIIEFESREATGRRVGTVQLSGAETLTEFRWDGTVTSQYFEPDPLQYTMKPGDTLNSVARHALSQAHVHDANYKPTQQEVLAAVDKLRKYNHLPEGTMPGPGTELNLPPEPQVARDDRGRVIHIEYTDGNSRDIRYDASGDLQLVKVHGATYEKKSDGWHVTDTSGKEQAHPKLELKQVGDGNLLIRQPGFPSRTEFSDGTSMDRQPDNSQVWRDAQQKVMQVDYPDGMSASIEYGKDGQPVLIKSTDGHRWEKDEHGWKLHYRGTVFQEATGVIVEPNGTIMHAMKDGSLHKLYRGGQAEQLS